MNSLFEIRDASFLLIVLLAAPALVRSTFAPNIIDFFSHNNMTSRLCLITLAAFAVTNSMKVTENRVELSLGLVLLFFISARSDPRFVMGGLLCIVVSQILSNDDDDYMQEYLTYASGACLFLGFMYALSRAHQEQGEQFNFIEYLHTGEITGKLLLADVTTTTTSMTCVDTPTIPILTGGSSLVV